MDFSATFCASTSDLYSSAYICLFLSIEPILMHNGGHSNDINRYS